MAKYKPGTPICPQCKSEMSWVTREYNWHTVRMTIDGDGIDEIIATTHSENDDNYDAVFFECQNPACYHRTDSPEVVQWELDTK